MPASSTEHLTKPLSQQLPSPAAGYSLLQLVCSVWTCKTQDKCWEPSACISPSSHPSPDRLFSPLTQGVLFLWAFSKHTCPTKPTYPHPKPSRRMPFISYSCPETGQGAGKRKAYSSASTRFTSLPVWASVQSRWEYFEVRPWVLAAFAYLLHPNHCHLATVLGPGWTQPANQQVPEQQAVSCWCKK